MARHISVCKRCRSHEGMDESFVICSTKGVNVMALSMPSFHEKGFKNGERIVHCPEDK